MVGPLAAASRELEAAGAGILKRQPLHGVGIRLVETSVQLEKLSRIVEELSQSSSSTSMEPYGDGMLSAQRMAYGAERMKVAGMELMKGGDGTNSPKSSSKAWLKNG